METITLEFRFTFRVIKKSTENFHLTNNETIN